jgi:hypothetical protein
MEPDFLVRNHGTVWQFWPVSGKAVVLSLADLCLEDWQWSGRSFILDHRPARQLAVTLAKDGFILVGG